MAEPFYEVNFKTVYIRDQKELCAQISHARRSLLMFLDPVQASEDL